ncbi:MAG TPA: hypothetical protein VHF47_13530 [Acidimicrobiales bacterium]|nr:hypothetical protein [Acidimicrobiales bacterium]
MLRVAHDVLGRVDNVDREALYLALRRTAEAEPGTLEANIHQLAAALLEGLLAFHPFALDNEEIARRAVGRFYEVNGWVLADSTEIARLIADMGTGHAATFAGAAVLARHARRLDS